MRKKIIATTALLMSLCGFAYADATQTLTINGENVTRTVSQFTFDGNNVVVHFSDSNESYPLDNVVLEFNQTTGIGQISVFKMNTLADGSLDISGLSEKTHLNIFDSTGKEVSSQLANGSSVHLDISGLASGIYILKANDNIIKFIKK